MSHIYKVLKVGDGGIFPFPLMKMEENIYYKDKWVYKTKYLIHPSFLHMLGLVEREKKRKENMMMRHIKTFILYILFKRITTTHKYNNFDKWVGV